MRRQIKIFRQISVTGAGGATPSIHCDNPFLVLGVFDSAKNELTLDTITDESTGTEIGRGLLTARKYYSIASDNFQYHFYAQGTIRLPNTAAECYIVELINEEN